MRNFLLVVLTLASVSVSLLAAEVRIFVTGRFGHVASGCNVASFRSQSNGIDYSSTFIKLASAAIPVGFYEVRVSCGEHEGFQVVDIQSGSPLHIIPLQEQLMRSDAPGKLLLISLDLHKRDDKWWINLLGVYNNRTYAAMFDAHGTAKIQNLESGSYIVMVHRIGGFACAVEIDAEEWTRQWSVDPYSCNFRVDEFSHVVTTMDKNSGKQAGWYEKMFQRRNQVKREIRNIIEGQHNRQE